ncbi:MAG: biotin--[acetyl-CoA-carboxylase] ligase [Planctomycetales bacterium]|nr:biotin--[acetyl-CoA-carboxylase] ligase [Planctomycetales bacterium]
MTQFDLPKIRSSPHVAALEHHEQIGSTSDRALELARQDQLALPMLILTDQQTGGRGRGSNQWWAAAGSLTFSLLIDSQQLDIASQKWPVLSLSTGLAICEALEQIAPGGDFGVKWPNDVYCAGRKLCGILIESPSASRGRVIVGIGLNVNNSLAAAPSEIQSLATSLVDYLQRPLDITGVLLSLLTSLRSRWQELGSNGLEPQVAEFRRRCVLDGRTVQVSSGSRLITGRCLGIDDNGSLVLQTEIGREAIASGSVMSIQ